MHPLGECLLTRAVRCGTHLQLLRQVFVKAFARDVWLVRRERCCGRCDMAPQQKHTVPFYLYVPRLEGLHASDWRARAVTKATSASTHRDAAGSMRTKNNESSPERNRVASQAPARKREKCWAEQVAKLHHRALFPARDGASSYCKCCPNARDESFIGYPFLEIVKCKSCRSYRHRLALWYHEAFSFAFEGFQRHFPRVSSHGGP